VGRRVWKGKEREVGRNRKTIFPLSKGNRSLRCGETKITARAQKHFPGERTAYPNNNIPKATNGHRTMAHGMVWIGVLLKGIREKPEDWKKRGSNWNLSGASGGRGGRWAGTEIVRTRN